MRIGKPLKRDWPVSLKFGQYAKPFYILTPHKGIDYACPIGEPVRAVADGEWEFHGWKDGTYGNHVILKHKDGYETLYAHLSEINFKNGWTRAKAGDVIGLSGKSGFWKGLFYAPHLHFEVRKGGKAVDPQPLMNAGSDFVRRLKGKPLLVVDDGGKLELPFNGGFVEANPKNCYQIIKENDFNITVDPGNGRMIKLSSLSPVNCWEIITKAATGIKKEDYNELMDLITLQ